MLGEEPTATHEKQARLPQRPHREFGVLQGRQAHPHGDVEPLLDDIHAPIGRLHGQPHGRVVRHEAGQDRADVAQQKSDGATYLDQPLRR
jgi:hypothetical protein